MNAVFWQLIHRDLHLFKYNFTRGLLNGLIWLSCVFTVGQYILPAMQMERSFGFFVLIGSLATISLFRCVNSIPILLNDIEPDGPISYYLSLPIRPAWIFIRYAISFAITSALIFLSILVIAKLILWDFFSLAHFSVAKFMIMFLVMHLFAGFFTLLIAAYTPGMSHYENIWSRVIFPLWFLGGYQFTWFTLLKQLPLLAYFDLLNPMIYLLEGFRVAFLGQSGYLNFWVTTTVLAFFTILCAWLGVKKMLRRLDCV